MLAGDSTSLDLTDEEWKQHGLDVPILSSEQLNWRGLSFAYYRQPPHEIPVHSHTQHVIAICVQPYAVSFKTGRCWDEYYMWGDVVIFPAHQASPMARCDQDVEYINLYLDPSALTDMARESIDTDCVELTPQLKVHDPLIHQMGLALKTELELHGADSGLYAESMATALSVHLLRRYSTKCLRLPSNTDGLPKSRLREAIAYINDHLDQDLRLADIAAVVHIIPILYKAALNKASRIKS